MARKKKQPTSKDLWVQDEHKSYLWMNDTDHIQAMVFQNLDDKNIFCLWVKVLHEEEFVSNYFVYSNDQIQMHPLDYAITMVQRFKEENDNGENVST